MAATAIIKAAPKRITNARDEKWLFICCWISYTFVNIGRLNLAATMGSMIINSGFTKSELGFVAASFFFSYGIGQIFSGILGDRFRPSILVFLGLFLSSLVNLSMGFCDNANTMAILWFINGLSQSLIWSPTICLLSTRLHRTKSIKATVNIATTVPAGTLLTYLICSLFVRYLNWHWVFYFASCLLLITSFFWLFIVYSIEKRADTSIDSLADEQIPAEEQVIKNTSSKTLKIILSSGVLFIIIGSVFHGILKDGIMSWVPTYLHEIFNTGDSLSMLLTMILPIINLSGVYSASFLNRHIFHNEILTAAAYFILSLFAIILLYFFGSINIIFTILLMALVTASMIAVNTMTLCVVPVYFKKIGKVSTICGLLNFFIYMGSAASTYGFGTISDNYGWGVTRIIWAVISLFGAVSLFLGANLWKKFKSLSE